MQDHYVEVHTAAGSELLLLRFRDALREVEGVDGLQVHRSHWVARNAVARVERRRGGGRVALRLVNGSKVPDQPLVRAGAPIERVDLSRDESKRREHRGTCRPPFPPGAPSVAMPADPSTLPGGFRIVTRFHASFDDDGVRRGRLQPPAIFGIRCTSLSGPIREKSASW